MLGCADCDIAYGSAWWADFVVSDKIWSALTASDNANLLCVSCMIKRANLLGLERVDGAFTSGPFTRHDWIKP